MKKKNKKAVALVLSGTAIILIGSAMAYFTSVDNVTNRFIAGKLDITLTESNWKPENAVNVVPGDVIEKNPTITSNEDAECYLFMRVTVPCDSPEIEYDSGEKGALRPTDKSALPMYKFIVTENDTDSYDDTTTWNQNVHDCYTLVNAPVRKGNRLIYTYAYVDENTKLISVKKGETTEKPLFDKIKIWNFNEKYLPDEEYTSPSYDVTVEAFAIQSEYLSADAENIQEVWNKVKTER